MNHNLSKKANNGFFLFLFPPSSGAPGAAQRWLQNRIQKEEIPIDFLLDQPHWFLFHKIRPNCYKTLNQKLQLR